MFSRFETPAHPNRTRGIAEIVFGVIAMVVGVGLSLRSIDDAQRAAEATGTGTYSIYLGLIVGAIFALARGIHDVYATAAVRSRSREERIVRDLVIGAALAVLVIVTALSLSGRALWANGLIVTTGLLLTIALLLIGRGLAMRWPEAQLAHDGSITEPGTGLRAAIGITVIGFALLALGIWRGAGADTSSVFEVFAIHALVVAGLGFATEGVARWRSALPDKVTRVSVTADAEVLENAERRRRRMIIEIVAGGILVLAGLVVLTVVYTTPSRTVADHVAAYGPIVGGLAIIVRALMSGFKSFVAWRYLLVFEVKVTARARIAVMLVLGLASCVGLAWAIGHYTTSSVFDATSSLVTRPLIIAVATFFAVAGVVELVCVAVGMLGLDSRADRVPGSLGSAASRSFARPQSITTVSPKSPIRMLPGLRSRWMTR